MRQLQQEDFDNYVEQIVNLFISSNNKSSTLFDLKIKGNDAKMSMSIVEQSGEKNEIQKVNFRIDDNLFDDFIKKLVSEVYDNTNVSVSDVVNLDGDNYYAFRMITEKYDLFVIDGLEKSKAYELLDGLNKEKEGCQKVFKNNNGTGDILLFFIIISTLIISFISVVVFLG